MEKVSISRIFSQLPNSVKALVEGFANRNPTLMLIVLFVVLAHIQVKKISLNAVT